jgi:CUB domain
VRRGQLLFDKSSGEQREKANLWARGVCCRCEATSASDFVEFSNYMAQDRKYSRYCGQLREFDVESDRHFFRVTFRSNDRLDGTGFHATYQFLEQEDTNTVRPVRTSTSVSGKNDHHFFFSLTYLHMLVALSSNTTNSSNVVS